MMHWQYSPYVIPLAIAGGISATIAVFAWRWRPASGATSFSLLMLAVAEWSLGYALELGSTDLSAQIFWAKVQYLGIVSVPVMWLIFALQYTGREEWLTGHNLALLAVVPLITVLLVWTNDAHGLIWSSIGQNTDGSFLVLDLTYGAWFWVHWMYSYLLLLLGTILLIRVLIRSEGLYRGQALVLVIGMLAPWVGNALYVSGLNPFPHLDLTPLAFTLSGLAGAWGLARLRLLDIVPIARDVVIESMSDGVIVLDAQNRIVDLNPIAEHIIGRSAVEAIGQPISQVISGRLAEILVECCPDLTVVQEEIVLGEGEAEHWFDLRISPLRNQRGRVIGRVVILHDITARKRAEETIEQMAYHDALTGLPNRRLFADRLNLALAHAQRSQEKLAVMLLDLDHFKDVNDTLGHSVGDKLLQSVGQRLSSILRKSDTVARMGGDEFLLLLPEISGEEDAVKIATKVLEAFEKPFVCDGHELQISTSIGIAIYPDDGGDSDTLVRNADIAMYRAKRRGRANYQRYTPTAEDSA